jgi:TatD DNase family protein
MMLVDSHCHLDFPEFAPERDAVVERARAVGVHVMQTICTRLSRAAEVAALAAAYDGVWCSVGVHPHNVAEEEVSPEALVAACGGKVIGLGETGLDYYYDHAPRGRQAEAFRAHVAAARATGLPLIVHSRDADDDTVAILKGEGGGAVTGVIHCFTSDRAMARACLDLGFVVSFSGIVTFRNAAELREVARFVPEDRFLVETDAPYLAPVPMRGKRNEPAFVAHTAARVAELRGVPVEALAEATTATFFRLFRRAAP